MSLNPAVLKLDLLCKGIKIDASCQLHADARPILRTRGGLGSGLELLLPPDVYVNVPTEEHFVEKSPYALCKRDGAYYILHNNETIGRVRLPPKPAFYDRKTSSGKPMSRIGVMQGTYLGIYPTRVCEFWQKTPRMNCGFCSVGLNVGNTEEREKSVADVLETVQAARREEGITFVHFNTGYLSGEELDIVEPYVKAVKERTGLLVGVQCPPCPHPSRYDHFKKIGVDHVSFCLELYDPERFREVCPGKYKYIGREKFFEIMQYCVKIFGKGRVSGEIIAGLEPPEGTIQAIERFTSLGIVPTVCIFRPCRGTDLEHLDPPRAETMVPVFKRLYTACMENKIPFNIAPNIKVSLVLLPEECRYFLDRPNAFFFPETRMNIMRSLYRAYFRSKILFKRR